MTANETARSALKTELFQRIEALDQQKALLPATEEVIESLVQQLELITPTPHPLRSDHLPILLGTWRLLYASQGTVVTRQIASLPFANSLIPRRIWQTLTASAPGTIRAENGAIFDLPLLGEWQLRAEGVWIWGADEQIAKVTFETFALQATQFLGQASWRFPELRIPVLESLRNEALWSTSYLEPDLRIGRGATGNLFVFRREL
jgi:hypothetical protein